MSSACSIHYFRSGFFQSHTTNKGKDKYKDVNVDFRRAIDNNGVDNVDAAGCASVTLSSDRRSTRRRRKS